MQIYITQELEQRLRNKSKQSEVPMSQILAVALERYLGGTSTRVETVTIDEGKNSERTRTVVVPKTALDIPGVSKGSEFVPKPPDPEFGYPCCKANRPCKHWIWDGNLLAYVNSLTGKEREAV